MNIVPVEIRKHLILFFFEEMVGTPANFDGQKVKMIPLAIASSLAGYLYTLTEIDKTTAFNEKFLLYLSIQKKGNIQLSGSIYIEKKGVKEVLLLDQKKVRAFNNLLEDIFRTSLVFFVDGISFYQKSAAQKNISDGIKVFVDRYSLEEYGLEIESIRNMYYFQKNKKRIQRFQTKFPNNSINFA